MSYCIIGGGAAGILACLELIHSGKQPSDITWIDPYFDGGALARHWGGISSNTVWSQITDTMAKYPSAQKAISELSKKYEPQSRILLTDLGWLLLESVRCFFPEVTLLLDHCLKIQQQENGWEITTSSGTVPFKAIFLCQGGKQKRLDFGKSLIPIEIALDPSRISRVVRPNQSVAVVGLAHSGTLICKHLLDLGAKVYGIYRTEKPFLYDRDGAYDGIKQESAEIADKLLETNSASFELIRYTDTPKLVKVLGKVSWVVSAIGFEASPIQILDAKGGIISSEAYNPETAEIALSLYGFGLAYPGVTNQNGKLHKDVSIPAFAEQIRRCLPSILSKS
jgi:hypothetical protein